MTKKLHTEIKEGRSSTDMGSDFHIEFLATPKALS
jgi:hypothetical protein